MTVAVIFALLLIANFARSGLPSVRSKSGADWLLDVAGLTVQGTFVPVAQMTVVAVSIGVMYPGAIGSIHLPGWASFLLCFVGVDYAYYWNHRLLHSRLLWPAHVVHHTVTELDVLGTSRNTLWSSALILYLWVNGAMICLLSDPTPYAIGVSASAALDLWRHSSLQPPAPLARVLGLALILPDDHAWHHSDTELHANYGANLRWWDQLHGTWYPSDAPPQTLGVQTKLSLGRKLFWPFE